MSNENLGKQWIAEIIGDVKKQRDDMQKHLSRLKNEGHYKQAHVDALALLNAMLSAAAPQVVADERAALVILQDIARAWNNERDIELDSVMEKAEVFLLAHRASASLTMPAHLKPTDISKRLREYAGNSGYSHNDYADTMRAAADEIERYYGGMLNWKATAEAKDASPVQAQEPVAVVYPADGTVSPFTVINLGHGLVKMGDSLHDGRLPALWFGKDGLGMGVSEEMNRAAKEGETLAVVTFSNVEGLDVLAEVLQRIRSEAFPAAPVQPVAVPDGKYGRLTGDNVAQPVQMKGKEK